MRMHVYRRCSGCCGQRGVIGVRANVLHSRPDVLLRFFLLPAPLHPIAQIVAQVIHILRLYFAAAARI